MNANHRATIGLWVCLFCAGAALLLRAPLVLGQDITATVTGTVTDPSGAVIPGAAVTVKDLARDVTYTAQTNSDGVYYLERLPIGSYDLKVEAKGFQTAQHSAFNLVVNQVARVDVQMTVGEQSQTLEVSSAAPLLQTDTTDIGAHLDNNVTQDIPLITHNYNQLSLLTPGAVSTNPGSFTSGQNTFQVGRPYINGNREQTNNYLLDGIDNREADNDDVGYAPNADAIQEVNIIAENPPADFGNYLGGIINVLTKSGTNSYHGSAFEYFRNDKLDANSWSNNLSGIPKAAFHYNLFGATFGGPIIKNRLFFFADYQGQREDTPSTQSVQLMSAAERAGNFGELCQNLDGSSGFNSSGLCASNNPGADTQLFAPSAGVAPASRPFIPFNNLTADGLTLSHAASAIVNSSLYPAANEPGNFFQYQQRVLNNDDQGDIRVDWTPSTADRIWGRYSQQFVSNPTTATFLLQSGGITDFTYPLHNFVADWTHIINSNFLNDFRVGFSYFPIHQTFANPTGQNLPQMFGIPGSPSTFLPSLGGTFGNVTGIGNNLAQSNIFADTVIQIGDTIVKTMGRHEVHAGFQFNRYRDNFLFPGIEGLAGQFNFNGQYTANTVGGVGSGLADFMLGLPNSLGIGANVGNRHVNNSLYGLFVQDNWRFRNNLTFNGGLRWDLNTPRASNQADAANYSEFGGQLITANVNNMGLGNALYKQYNGINNFEPRLGLAWQPGFLKQTVIRAAFGISTFMESNGVNNLLTANPPFEQTNSITFAAASDLPGSTLDDGFTGFPSGCTVALAEAFSPLCFSGVTTHSFDIHLRPAVHDQWNVGIQHQFGNYTTVQASYIGEDNHNLSNIIMMQQEQLNADGTISPSPFLNAALLAQPGQRRLTLSNGVGNYNALQLIAQERLSEGLQAQVNYTWSKCLSDTPGFFGQFGDNVPDEAQTISAWAFPQNPYDQRGDYGRCPQNIASLFNGYVIYELPFGRGRKFASGVNKAVDEVIGGWRLTGDFIFHTGFAQTIFANADTSGTGGFSTRADCVKGVSPTVPMTFDPITHGVHFLNPAAVTTPAAGTFGNCAVGVFDGPGYKSSDLSLAKNFIVTEKSSLEFRADFSNFTNTPIFDFGQEFSGQHTAVASNYGEIFTSQGERNIQLGLKYTF